MQTTDPIELVDNILRIAHVENVVGLPRSSIYSAIQRGDFPEPVRLTPRTVGWKQAEIQAWIDSRNRVPLNADGSPDMHDLPGEVQ